MVNFNVINDMKIIESKNVEKQIKKKMNMNLIDIVSKEMVSVIVVMEIVFQQGEGDGEFECLLALFKSLAIGLLLLFTLADVFPIETGVFINTGV
ncbi:MAG: hypothetical protein EZS28_018796 [Streblomastix strix]|uniref:Uncharacterized protein n=1 Tax=Streblomastix strix TaxID=222440 RepID=A0A5J4VST7_9EUKA|nr:MAG: hypothetical protein EZS28_018796 [Streblomastix strix]